MLLVGSLSLKDGESSEVGQCRKLLVADETAKAKVIWR